jgi:hypothetical protein
MNKKDKAQKILTYLGSNGEDWIAADCSPSGKIAYIVNGIQRKIYTYTDCNLTDSSRVVAQAVIDADFDYGNCKNILKDEQDEKCVLKNWIIS